MLIWIVEVRILLYTTTLVHINGSSSTLLVENGICTLVYTRMCARAKCDVLPIAQVFPGSNQSNALLIDALIAGFLPRHINQ